MQVGKIIENDRTTRSTAMNYNSSRTHCLVELKMYRKSGDQMHITSMKFFDLCGSERFERTGGHLTKEDNKMIEAIMTNYSLTVLARVISQVAGLKKPLCGGEKIPDATFWKESSITRILQSSWDGSAFTVFVFCCSLHERNFGETWCTMKLTELCHNLKASVKRPKSHKLAALKKHYQESIKKDEETIKKLNNAPRQDPTAINLRESLVQNAKDKLELFDKLE